MTEEKAIEARRLLNAIHNLEYVIDRLKEEREARGTGLDYKCPGPRRHVIRTLDEEWELVGEKTVAFFCEVMDMTIRVTEAELTKLKTELSEL